MKLSEQEAKDILQKMEDYAISFTDEGWWIFHELIPKLDTENQQEILDEIKAHQNDNPGYYKNYQTFVEASDEDKKESWEKLYIEYLEFGGFNDGDIPRYFIFELENSEPTQFAVSRSEQIAFGRPGGIKYYAEEKFNSLDEAKNYVLSKGIMYSDPE